MEMMMVSSRPRVLALALGVAPSTASFTLKPMVFLPYFSAFGFSNAFHIPAGAAPVHGG